MARITFIIFAVLLAGVVILIGPFLYPTLKSRGQIRALKSRSDYPQIATACVTLARSVTNYSRIKPSDPRVPALLRSLSPRYITAGSNSVTMEFHGGFNNYGYRVEQSDDNANLWRMYWYFEKNQRLLSTISQN